MLPLVARLVLLLGFGELATALRRYNLTITINWSSADGHGRPLFAMNGQSPGPLIEAEEGEEVEVFVDNQLATETTMHWHGVYQVDQPWNDGVPGVTQYSIQPRDNYTYRFTVQHGQRGPIWISPAAWRPRPYELVSSSPEAIQEMRHAEKHPRHVVISDWNAEPMDILLIMYRDTGIVPWCSNSIVLNGKGRTYCHSEELIEMVGGPGRNSLGCTLQPRQANYANENKCQATSGKLEVITAEDGEDWIWINFIRSGAHHELQISVDEHEIYVVAADGEFVHPQKVHAANCNLGERISILVHLDQKPGDYAIRNGSVVDIIFENGANVTSQHPFHKHNHKAWIIGTGHGGFPWATVADAIEDGAGTYFNLVDPPIRDGCRLGNNTGDWTVIRYEIFFPAASMLHCHMIHHFAAGQQVVILEGVESMAKIPEEVKNRVHADFVPPLRYGPLD
ncbi:hypothetical protein ACJZ2D_011543 [Fusarium nematophilum]